MNDVTAIGSNAAGLAYVTRPEFGVVSRLLMTGTAVHATNPPPVTTPGYDGLGEAAAGAEFVEFIGAALPFRIGGRLVVAGVAWRQFATGRRSGRYHTQILTPLGRYTMNSSYNSTGGLRALSPSLAIALTDRMRVGVTANFLSGSSTYTELGPRTYTISGTNVFPGPPHSSHLVERDHEGLAVAVGALVDATHTLRLGTHLTLPHQRRMTIDNDTTLRETTLNAPLEAAVGVTKLISERARVSLDYRYAPWSRSTLRDAATGDPIATEVGVVDARSIHLGYERELRGGRARTAFRLGTFVRRTTGADFDGVPVDGVGLTVGETLRFGTLALDYGLLYSRSSAWTRSETSQLRVRLTNHDFVLSAGLRRRQ